MMIEVRLYEARGNTMDFDRRIEAINKLKEPEPRFVKHEWLEFAEKLANLDDLTLRGIGQRELAKLQSP